MIAIDEMALGHNPNNGRTTSLGWNDHMDFAFPFFGFSVNNLGVHRSSRFDLR